MTGFQDHFAPVSAHYAAARPGYPPALVQWLAAQCPSQQLAWDCGTGSGQAALSLVAAFEQVIASDASAAQLAQAVAHPRIHYRIAPAEDSGLIAHSIDLVTVAQALHWFDLPRFHAEVRRVLKPVGLFAAWCYGVLAIEDNAIDAIVQRFYHDTLGPHWPAERRLVEGGYRDLSFPLEPLPVPEFAMEAGWTLGQLLGYVRSWSATARYLGIHGEEALVPFVERLSARWGAPERVQAVTWPLTLLAGRPANPAPEDPCPHSGQTA